MSSERRFDLAIKWGPAWLDQPADAPDNEDRNFYEALTLEEAFDVIRGFPSPILEVTLEPTEEG